MIYMLIEVGVILFVNIAFLVKIFTATTFVKKDDICHRCEFV